MGLFEKLLYLLKPIETSKRQLAAEISLIEERAKQQTLNPKEQHRLDDLRWMYALANS
jgi:hypothetical protein